MLCMLGVIIVFEYKKGNNKKGPQCYMCKVWGHMRINYP